MLTFNSKVLHYLVLLYIFYFMGSIFASNFDRMLGDAPDFEEYDVKSSFVENDDNKIDEIRREFARENNLKEVSETNKSSDWSIKTWFKKFLYILIGDGVKNVEIK